MKKCKVCDVEQPLSEYYKAKESVDGHSHKCKKCSRLASKKWREANPERRKEQFKEWVSNNKDHRQKYSKKYYENNKEDLLNKKRISRRANPEKLREEKRQYREKNADKYNESQRKWREENPIKVSAHQAVREAVVKGELIKPVACSCCNVFTDTLHAHHDDYLKKLDVRWLCALCHSDWHKNNKAKI